MKKLLLLLSFICASYSAFSNATVSQKDWRWRKDDDSETAATWAANENEGISQIICPFETVRLRMSFFVQYDRNPPVTVTYSTSTVDYRIAYATDVNGPFKYVCKDSSTLSSEHFMLAGSNFVNNNTTTTQQLSTSGAAYLQGTVIDSNRTSNIVFQTTNQTDDNMTEYEWLIKPTVNALAQTYYFKLESLTGTYLTLPELTLTSTLNAAVSVNGATLTADNATATSYQWIDCDNGYAEIDGETNQTFTATRDGYYAVIITEDDCERTSLCTSVVVTGITDNNSNPATLAVHPNPSNGIFVLEAQTTVTVAIYNQAGQLVLNKTMEAGSNTINLDAAGTGIYFLTATDAKGNRTSQKIVLSK